MKSVKPMKGKEFAAIRAKLDCSAVEFARALGYGAAEATATVMMSRFENGARAIPSAVGRLARMFDRHGIPGDFQ